MRALIKLAYKQIIDKDSIDPIAKKIFDDSYAEFIMKIQAYNLENKFNTFSAIVANDGRANSLHYKTSFAILHHLDSMKNKIPGLFDQSGRLQVPFSVPEFKVIESSTVDRSMHKVMINYITDTFTLVNSFGEYLVLAAGDQSTNNHDSLDTFTLKMQDGLSIISWKDLVGVDA